MHANRVFKQRISSTTIMDYNECDEERSWRMYNVDNKKIGAYLKRIIEKKFISHRQFCRKYLEAVGVEADNEELRKMGNRLSQILKGTKGVQIYDLPVFTELLGVSCEEILSAGKKKYVPTAAHVTNYDIAYSKDPRVWKEYVEREDKLILNCDEYGKTIIDYIFEFRNYKFLKYLLQEKVIWLVDNSGWDGMTYGAGTNIKRREIEYIDISMPLQIKYEDQIRTQALALAIENKDSDMLDKLCARENPGLHELYSFFHGFDSSKYYNEDLAYAIANSGEEMLDYFSQEFIVEDMQKRQNKYIYPYLGNVIDIMLQNNCSGVELLIRRTITHNKQAYERLSNMVNEAYRISCESFAMELGHEIKEELRIRALDFYSISEQKDMVSFFYSTGKKASEYFATNIVNIINRSSSTFINELINESNEWYEKIISMKGESNE